jgi:pyruvate,orthophosphate dikinase
VRSGCRLGIVHPEISKMQALAIFEAAATVMLRGARVFPHIMVPLVALTDELDAQAAVVRSAAQQVAATTGERRCGWVGGWA